MSNDPIREVTAHEAWRAVSQSSGSGGDGGSESKGHPDQIEDVVAIQANVEILDKLKSSKNTDEVLAMLPYEKKQQEDARQDTPKERILEYMKLPGERIDEPYMFDAAREAMFELIVDTSGDFSDHEKSIATFTAIFAQKIREKELSPINQPDSEGKIDIEG